MIYVLIGILASIAAYIGALALFAINAHYQERHASRWLVSGTYDGDRLTPWAIFQMVRNRTLMRAP